MIIFDRWIVISVCKNIHAVLLIVECTSVSDRVGISFFISFGTELKITTFSLQRSLIIIGGLLLKQYFEIILFPLTTGIYVPLFWKTRFVLKTDECGEVGWWLQVTITGTG